MFGLNKNMQRQLKGWLYTALLILVGLLFGQEHFPSQRQTWPSAPLPDAVKGAGRTIDGDSLWVGKDEVRLKGIDAPEGRQTCQCDGRDWACGDATRDELRRLIGKDMVE